MLHFLQDWLTVEASVLLVCAKQVLDNSAMTCRDSNKIKVLKLIDKQCAENVDK